MTERIPTRQSARIAHIGQRIRERYRDYRSPEQRANRAMKGLLKSLSFAEEWTAGVDYMKDVSSIVQSRIPPDHVAPHYRADWIVNEVDQRVHLRPNLPDTLASVSVFIATNREFLQAQGLGDNRTLHYMLEKATNLEMDVQRREGEMEAKMLFELDNLAAGTRHTEKYRELVGVKEQLQDYADTYLK